MVQMHLAAAVYPEHQLSSGDRVGEQIISVVLALGQETVFLRHLIRQPQSAAVLLTGYIFP